LVQRIVQNGYTLQQVQKPSAAQIPDFSESFGSVLHKISQKLTVSAHAQERIKSRNISFGQAEQSRLEDAVGKANTKGARQSLVLMDGNAFVVSVSNNTIVTAMDGMNVKDNVFTNIDSAVIA
jgi:flagellar operon protein